MVNHLLKVTLLISDNARAGVGAPKPMLFALQDSVPDLKDKKTYTRDRYRWIGQLEYG